MKKIKTCLSAAFIFMLLLSNLLSAGEMESSGAALPDIDTITVYSTIKNVKKIYQYDQEGRRQSVLQLKQSGNDWLPDERRTYTYDQDKLAEVLYEYVSEGDWVNSIKQIYTYDDNGNVTVFLEQEWNPDMNSWVNSSRNSYEYVDNKVVSDIDEYWANEWIKHRRYTTKYNT